MMNLDELTQLTADHIATRPVKIVWDNPPSPTAAGQCYKTRDGRVIVFVGNLSGTESKLRVLVHECLHGRLDYDILPYWEERKNRVVPVKSQAERNEWRENPREQRVKRLAGQLMDYVEKHMHDYFGRPAMEAKLLALLDWKG